MDVMGSGRARWRLKGWYPAFVLASAAAMTFCGCCCEDGPPGPPGPAGPTGPGGSSPVIIVPDSVETVQAALEYLPDEGGTVYIRAGTYVVSEGIHIDRSNVALIGDQGAVLRLGDHVNHPVLLIGADEEVPATATENIRIAGLEIDGNKDSQDSETDPGRPWIRNNGIDVRNVTDLRISDVDIHDARSGGLVVSWDCRTVFVSESSFHSNHFDGIALYSSEDIQVSEFHCYENGYAGLSLDNGLKHVAFDNGSIKNNGDVGIFARDSEDLSFHDLMIWCNASHGCFLSHNTPGTDTGVKRLFFESCSFLDNKGHGLWLASPATESPNNTVVGCLFSGNALDSIKVDPGGELFQEGNVFQGPGGEDGCKHFFYGCPTGTPATNNRIVREIYALSSNDETKFADWVVYRLDEETVVGEAETNRYYKTDPLLDPDETLEPDDYEGAYAALEVDHGHQAPLASFKGTDLWADTNYLSNITPQKYRLNRWSWKRVEDKVRDIVEAGNVVYVMTGPLYERDMPSLPGADEPHSIPSGYWKVVAVETDAIRCAAFIFDQETPTDADILDHLCTVDEVETRSGLDLMTRLPDCMEEAIEGDLFEDWAWENFD